MSSLGAFLRERLGAGGFTTEDTLASLLPLMKQVADTHAAEMVAPLQGIDALRVEGTRIYFHNDDRGEIQNQLPRVLRVEHVDTGPVDVVSRHEEIVESGAATVTRSLDVVEDTDLVERPAFVPRFRSWEHLLDHHDPVTDIFSLGQLLACVALGLDFRRAEDLRHFVEHRRNLFAINPDVHPVIARAIEQMTELHREKRVQELPPVIRMLEHYRRQYVPASIEPAEIEGFASRDLQGKQQVLLDRLQQRLFEVSRRNRLLHFRPSMQSVNLTQASVPLSFDYKNIRPDQIFTCDDRLQRQIAEGNRISLNERLNFAEAIYLPHVLNRILRETRRDMAEYGFVQLRLALCMLQWSNLKEKPAERFNSPLILVPVMLRKQRGVRDSYVLEPLSSDAEVNPVVRYLFKQLYDIRLPETIDLETADVDSLYEFMVQAIRQSEPAVRLKKIDRPQIRVLHSLARRSVDRYRRRARISGRGVRKFLGIDYSYDPANYHPAGIKIFSQRLTTPEINPGTMREAMPPPRYYAVPEEGEQPTEDKRLDGQDGGNGSRDSEMESRGLAGGSEEPPRPPFEKGGSEPVVEQKFYEMKSDDDDNPYNWQFDLCNVTLSNFRYRKMSLVRDYETLVAESPPNPAFEAAFSLVPRPVRDQTPAAPPLSDRYDVVPCDPTQATSIAQARVGDSYIIQGPPGTGKSQTITNLIADYAARGQRVLFVCEKRAAIDVVFARLRQCGLGELCCLIHDSQADKKMFVMDLKNTYETFLNEDSRQKRVAEQRTTRVTEMNSALEPLQQWSDAMLETTWRAGIPTCDLLQLVIAKRHLIPQLDELQKERLPSYKSWHDGRASIEVLVDILQQQQPEGILARHPLRNLSARLSAEPHPLQLVTEGTAGAQEILAELIKALQECVPLDSTRWTAAQVRTLITHALAMLPLAEANALALLDRDSAESAKLDEELGTLQRLEEQLTVAQQENSAWKEKLAERDVQPAIDAANALSKKWAPAFFPSWWRLRKVMNRSYDFSVHAVKPSWVSVLTALRIEYDAAAAVRKRQQHIGREFGWSGDIHEQLELIERIRRESQDYPEWLQEIHRVLVTDQRGPTLIRQLAGQDSRFRQLRTTLDEFLELWEPMALPELQCELAGATDSLGLLPDYLSCLEQLQHLPEEVRVALQHMDLPPEQIEMASAAHSLELIGRDQRELARFDQPARTRSVARLEQAHNGWMAVNAEHVREQTRDRFLDHVRQTSLPVSKLDPNGTEFKDVYDSGRRVLEHEFGKQMRYKSIRDLVSGDSGVVVRDLKPVWLMSPLSVSDTLPLGEQDFDVVIFDEASQITLEAAIPSLFRASQTIVVGDEQQLPPTDFFSTRSDESDEGIVFEHEGEMVTYDLESNSLLNHAARNLPSTMLGWHYRSRDEALISFSNWAFYDGRLMTIPEEKLPGARQEPLVADSAEAATAHVDSMFQRPISFHFMQHGVYLRRQNSAEAEYIAQLISELLKQKSGMTIGVIAFSEAQQTEIEEAISRLAKQDDEFSTLLEAELTREDDGQFTGLLVKNLENIQGDERDIILLSICYGPDDHDRMIMNFGPINKSGGEKRLNVAFSRAKHHMAVVSSIRYSRITNEYNVGSNCLRNYLRYAEAISMGDVQTATTVLRSLAPWLDVAADEQKKAAPVLQQIADRLAGHELLVDFDIGHSEFRCDIGVHKEGDTQYRLGILVDHGDYYRNGVELMDRELFRPRLLKIFGWDNYSVLARDWLDDPDRIVDEIVALCKD